MGAGMNLVGLIKIYSCHEFLPAVLPVVYDKIDKVVVVSSNISWDGERKNTVAGPFREWLSAHPECEKRTVWLEGDYPNQDDQYDAGYQYVRENMKDTDWVFLFDTDEVWHPRQLEGAIRRLQKPIMFDKNALCCTLETYIKNPLYKIFPPEGLNPVIFFRPIFVNMKGPRAIYCTPKYEASDIIMHHFTYVRENAEEVWKKIIISHTGDGAECNIDEWWEKVWKNLPRVENFHPTIGAASSWRKCIEVDKNDLPDSVLQLPWIQKMIEGGA
jgi:hypothetical protein